MSHCFRMGCSSHLLECHQSQGSICPSATTAAPSFWATEQSVLPLPHHSPAMPPPAVWGGGAGFSQGSRGRFPSSWFVSGQSGRILQAVGQHWPWQQRRQLSRVQVVDMSREEGGEAHLAKHVACLFSSQCQGVEPLGFALDIVGQHWEPQLLPGRAPVAGDGALRAALPGCCSWHGAAG